MEEGLSHKDVGNFGENIARKYLLGSGYEIIDTNRDIGRFEVDIIAHDGKTNDLVFVEVKTSKNNYEKSTYNPIQRVDWVKIKRIQHMAQRYITKSIKGDYPSWRIDIVGVVINPVLKKARVQHFKNI